MNDDESTEYQEVPPEIPWENQKPYDPLTPNELRRLSSLLNEIRDEFSSDRYYFIATRRHFIERLDELTTHRPDLWRLAYRKWLNFPEGYLDKYAPLYVDENDPKEMRLSTDLMLSFNYYAKAAMDQQQYRRYKAIWEDVSRMYYENRSMAEEGKEIYRRFCEVFRGHEFLMQRLALIKWLNPHNVQQKSPVRQDVKISPRYKLRI